MIDRRGVILAPRLPVIAARLCAAGGGTPDFHANAVTLCEKTL